MAGKKRYYYPEYHKAYYLKHREQALKDRKKYRKNHYSTIRNHRYLTTFGISLIDYEKLYALQNGVCAVCREPETATRQGKTVLLAVEHDHKTKQIRGLCCRRCNSVLGYVEDSPLLLRALAEYLEKANGVH